MSRAVKLTVGVPHGSEKLEGWWQKRILGRERQSCFEDTPFTINNSGQLQPLSPGDHTMVDVAPKPGRGG